MSFKLAIVGRPNVGKSTLFNRLVGRKLALVDNQPGVTRDLREGAARLGHLNFTVIDTAGLEEVTDESLQGRMRRLTERAVDMADACLHITDNLEAKDLYSQNISQINIGSGFETSIHDLAYSIAEIVDYKGDIKFDLTKPDGTMRKLLDCSRLNKLGYTAKIKPEDGLKDTYNWYLNNQDKLKL